MRPNEVRRFQLGGYMGGKGGAGVYQKIINLMPPHEVYIEPFLGGGAVMLRKRPARVNIGLDIDPDVIAAWDGPAGMLKMFGSPAMGAPRPAPAPGARPGDCAGRVAASSVARSSVTGSRRRTERLLATAATPGGCGDRCSAAGFDLDFRFECVDALEWLRSYGWTGRELVYCDPPYLHATRRDLSLYQHEMTGTQHRELLRIVLRLPCCVLISGYASTLYDRELAGWHRIEYTAQTRRGPVSECCWANFAEPIELHDYRYLGDNKRDRERIRRKSRRWTAKLGKMNRLERQALLMALSSTAAATDDARGVSPKLDRVDIPSS
ncbi:MAG TPA: hypothetical protein VN736_28755 [Candidatus Limnocylindrales bacterium]|nr:hypothetical protein [Candidatus Limnocylindrales bacterium]